MSAIERESLRPLMARLPPVSQHPWTAAYDISQPRKRRQLQPSQLHAGLTPGAPSAAFRTDAPGFSDLRAARLHAVG